MEFVAIILLVGLSIWIRRLQNDLWRHKKLSELAESVLWNTLMETNVVSQDAYDQAQDRFMRNVPAALTSDKKKLAKLKALRNLFKKEQD